MSTDSGIIHESLRSLFSATTSASLYGTEHPQVIRLAETAFTGISTALGISPEISLVVIEGELVINGEAPVFSLSLNRFAEALTSSGIGHLKFITGLSREEIDAFIDGIAGQGTGRKPLLSSEHLRLGQADLSLAGENGATEDSGHISFEELPAEELARFTEIYELLKSRSKLKISGLVEIVSAFIDTFRQEGEIRLVTAALRTSNEYSFTHAANVCILNLAQAIELGIDGKLLNDIGVASILHDIGKLFLPEEILTTTALLTDPEFRIMQEHPALGARHLLETPGIPRLAVVTAYEHHMRYNLSGYPLAPDGWRPNLCSQMTMISDFFDAMRTERSYRNAASLKTIADMMLEKNGTEFNPFLTRNFLNILKRVVTAVRNTPSTHP